MTRLKLSLKLESDIENLEKLNNALKLFSELLSMSKKCTCETNLVLEELFTNIIQHGCCEVNTHTIHITMSLKKDTIVIRIEDNGIPFNPIEVEPPQSSTALEDRNIGGLGLFLAKHYTDKIEYKRCGKKNILKLRKKLIPMPNEEKANGNH